MKPLSNIIRAFATGFITLTLLSIPLFWARRICQSHLIEYMQPKTRTITITPSNLLPAEIENDPNVAIHSSITASFVQGRGIELGIQTYFEDRFPQGRLSNTFNYTKEPLLDEYIIRFDKNSGLIVFDHTCMEKKSINTAQLKTEHLCAGPNAIADTPNQNFGKFIQPLHSQQLPPYGEVIIFDKGLRRFFRLDFLQRTVTKGSQLKKDADLEPIQIGSEFDGNPRQLYCELNSPRVKLPEPNTADPNAKRGYLAASSLGKYKPVASIWTYPGPYVPILDRSGRIDLLDKNTLELIPSAGSLPAPQGLFASAPFAKPKDLLAWQFFAVSLEKDSGYLGLAAAALSRDNTAIALAAFDKDGKTIHIDYSQGLIDQYTNRPIPSSRIAYFEMPGAPTLTISKYLLENLHPLALTIASILTADTIDARKGYTAIYLMPNSFVAMQARADTSFSNKYIPTMLLILPSLILSAFLAWRVAANASRVGLSPNAKLAWLLTTFAFGLPAYITYRLTRPKITLVTCPNCGKLRRPDSETCHHCLAKWLIPEITPPAWRVLTCRQPTSTPAPDAE